MADRQDQEAGANSTNLQAGRDIHYGANIAQVIQIAELTMDSRMDRLRGMAGEIAEARIREVLHEVGVRLQREPDEVQRRAKEPSFQFALLDVEKAYASSGDRDLSSRLTDMLVERTRLPERSLQQIVLGEALFAAPKLPSRSFDALTLLFILYNATAPNVHTFEDVVATLARDVTPFITPWPISEAEWRHMSYVGCATINTVVGDSLYGFATRAYPEAQLHKVPEDVFKRKLREREPRLGPIIETWDRNLAKSVALQSVGIAIAHNNWFRKTGRPIGDLSIWVH